MIPLFKPFIPPWEVLGPRLEQILYSGYIAEGDAVAEFEQKLSEYTGYPNIITTSSGTAALHLALMLAGVKEGDEVISTPMTAEPTNIAIKHAGGKVVWADVNPKTGLTDWDDVARINKRHGGVMAIVTVDYGGHIEISPYSPFSTGPYIIRDSAHSLHWNHLGAFPDDFTIFSFQSIKSLTTVDGGALAICDSNLLPLARRLRWFGMDRKAERTNVDIKEVGYKYHMNNVTATTGLVQLEYADDIIGKYHDNGLYYDNALVGVDGIEVVKCNGLGYNTYWLYTLLAENRDALIKKLQSRGIACGLVHRRNDEHSLFADSKTNLPGLDYFYSHYLHIPCGWWVTEEDREFIVKMIKEGW